MKQCTPGSFRHLPRHVGFLGAPDGQNVLDAKSSISVFQIRTIPGDLQLAQHAVFAPRPL